jgi:hypothetical protein
MRLHHPRVAQTRKKESKSENRKQKKKYGRKGAGLEN